MHEFIGGVLNRPFVVNWSEMSQAFNITAKQKAFRTPEQANAFIKSLFRREGFIKINYTYCRDNAWYQAHYL